MSPVFSPVFFRNFCVNLSVSWLCVVTCPSSCFLVTSDSLVVSTLAPLDAIKECQLNTLHGGKYRFSKDAYDLTASWDVGDLRTKFYLF